ncbi:hypothetical protein [Pontimicrobium sp. SW4]|uniref:Uncharacterized protein n=1 Tax=Pontimicrobium sp. SW4 TaxID=3153519 RepID=A0AAU7BT31_9FLAO
MKLLLTILFIFILPKECNNMTSNLTALQERQDTITITYEAVSRGFFEEISVSNNSFSICNDLNRKEYKTYECSEKDWSESLELLSKINIQELPKLVAPTSMRQYDGAAHATLIIKDGDNKIRSNTFDHGHPPEEIKALVEKLLSFKKIAIKQ